MHIKAIISATGHMGITAIYSYCLLLLIPHLLCPQQAPQVLEVFLPAGATEVFTLEGSEIFVVLTELSC
jgi:hypothetical protein